MAKLTRIDAELVRRGLARSRQHALQLIVDGLVYVDGGQVTKPARQISPAQAVVVKESAENDYVSRGAFKLAGALEYLGEKAPNISGKLCLDAGASTGGFTDVLLRNNAEKVIAADVGYGQLAWKLQSDSRVIVKDRTNLRYITKADLEYTPEIIVGDLSFISLTLLIEPLVGISAKECDFLLMVKPQFEVGKEKLPHGGVVKNPKDHMEAIKTVAQCAIENGLKIYAVAPSPLPGPSGNVEYFLAMNKSFENGLESDRLDKAIYEAVKNGPIGDRLK
ncbi:TlyA family RNA methyltransferase [Actinomyces sp. zg-332]|uniref:TlyA family RNA methyltransferase n=1 Tax=Actinomyces sp. zg-332 TaxID=2708340 RepID=UPI00141E10F9|nr:TlyA family RNA methyltransferase [Actinomyces sp. zg-332]QPK93736.1 TlyA family RNA methyltransferase [Actinomyces sp. zg-332]